MDRLLEFLGRLYTEAPWCYLSWPVAAMVVGTIAGALAGKNIARLGIVPRRLDGLPGLFTAPFVHANAAHLAANLPPFVVLGALVLRHGSERFALLAGLLALATGGLVWLLARTAAHVGMSGVIFAFLGHLLGLAWLTRTPADLAVAGGVLLYSGGMLASVAPARDGTSWESHLFGLLVGIGSAWLVPAGTAQPLF